jgi:signal transduction histidine kinase
MIVSNLPRAGFVAKIPCIYHSQFMDAIFAPVSRLVFCRNLMLAVGLLLTHAGQTKAGQLAFIVTNVDQASRLGSQNPDVSYAICMEGNVLWANAADGRLILQDESGIEELRINWHGQTLQPGQRVRLEGDGTLTKTGAGIQIGADGPVVVNNGIHSMIERSGSVYLKAGLQPISVDWFYSTVVELSRSSLILRHLAHSTGLEPCRLEINYQGPDLPRQNIPDSALTHPQTNITGEVVQTKGLNYSCYEITGEALPDFNQLTAVKTGTASNFDLEGKTRNEHIALQFTGSIKIPRDGLYTFYLTSVDGSQLFVGWKSLQLNVIGSAILPEPRKITLGQVLGDARDCQWGQVEGKVTFVSGKKDGYELELESETGRMRLEIADGSGLSAAQLMSSRIQAIGVCQSALNADGQKVADVLLVSGQNEIKIIQPKRSSPQKPGTLPLLTTASEVHQLTWEQAKLGYPVKVQGVITCILPEYGAFTIQDSTRGVYVVDYSESRSVSPKTGEFIEVEGTTDPSFFAPVVDAKSVNTHGIGRLPQPVRPSWDQLMNGSLDAQYVEVKGILTAVNANSVTLVTGDGRIKIELQAEGIKTEELRHYEDAVVRVRGCLFANWDYVTHQVKLGDVRIYGAKISVDQPAPADLFAIPTKSVPEVLQFNPQAGVFQRVKLTGQIIHVQPPKYYMMDGHNGLQFILKKPLAGLESGDLVEVAGFPELSGSSPILHEAVVRKTGHAALLEARTLQTDNLIQDVFDSTRVRVTGILANISETPNGQVLEIHNGAKSFTATLSPSTTFALLPNIGSTLELTGVYIGQGENLAMGQHTTSFDLLLDSLADIRVLAKPPWWTLKRLMIVVGALACGLGVTILWVTQLRRKVEERTIALAEQIQARQRVEQQRAMEQERSRIAQDLHDDLGSALTEIDLLVTLALRNIAPTQEALEQLSYIRTKSREIVTALDEIVWAVNPKNDSLKALVVYLSHFSEEFLRPSDIRCRLDINYNLPTFPLGSEVRHNLFLAFKEALNNAVRHSGATEVWVCVSLSGQAASLVIKDNGKGFVLHSGGDGLGNGLQNMSRRLEHIGGRCEVRSQLGGGTIVEFSLNQT